MRGLSTQARIARGAVAGLIAGAVASFVMDRFQAAASSLLPADRNGDEPATEKAADAVATAGAGHEVSDAAKPLAGQGIHYALGIGLGLAYGIVAEFRPSVTAGLGTVFGLSTATLLDESAVPAVGLADAPWKAPLPTTLYAYASHLVFGATAEIVRRQVAGTLTPLSETGS